MTAVAFGPKELSRQLRIVNTVVSEGLPGGGGEGGSLFPSVFSLCSQVPAAFPNLFPITYWFTTYPLPLIPLPPLIIKTTQKKQRSKHK